ncbi:MAG TPA: hypothetical protein VFP36_13110, partial [Usitatibacter sp.]|nr:hypothetical protein [Usitatibacter sp.]
VGAWVLNAGMSSGHRPGAAAAQTLSDIAHLPSLAAEATLLMSAGCAGSILASAFPESWAGAIADGLWGRPFLAILALIGMLIAMALAGVHPVLTSVFLASTFTPPVLGLPPIVHFCTILAGWGLSAALTPFSVLSMTASRFSGLSLARISIVANWRYTFACVALFTLALAGFVTLRA